MPRRAAWLWPSAVGFCVAGVGRVVKWAALDGHKLTGETQKINSGVEWCKSLFSGVGQ